MATLINMKVSTPLVPDGARGGTLIGGGTREEYPWGLRIHLEPAQLKALGVLTAAQLPPVSKAFSIDAKVIVCGAGANPSVEDGTGLYLDLQITDLALELAPDRTDAEIAQGLYSGTTIS